MHYKGKWLCAVIDGASRYLDGYITRSVGGANDVRIRENKDPNLTNPAFIEHAKELPWDGAYITGYRTKCGDMPLVTSFLALHQYVDGQEHVPSEKDVINAGQTFILSFPEAAKFDSLYLDNIHRNFRAGHSIGKPAIKKAKSWKTQCGIVHSNVQEDGERVTQATAELESTKQILEDIRLIHRKPITHGYFLVKDMPMHLSINGPIDVAWAEKELRRSHELGLDDPTWGFLTERFPKFPC